MRVSVKTVQRGIRGLLEEKLIYDISSLHPHRRARTYAFACDGVPQQFDGRQNVFRHRVKTDRQIGQNDGENLLNQKKGITLACANRSAPCFRGREGQSIGSILSAGPMREALRQAEKD
ncbi:MAG: hypothetical protein KKB78_05245 [Alphaproteobacteria bacterium]|nr:hypothetical protein [Alphaproteobacteria bacterium]MBU0864323.1 hypothetical protein [Alphaproteobacteria bacterium]